MKLTGRGCYCRKTPASFEPRIDYIITKMPRFTFEKFPGSKPELSTMMRSVGETMAMGRTWVESFQKACRHASGCNARSISSFRLLAQTVLQAEPYGATSRALRGIGSFHEDSHTLIGTAYNGSGVLVQHPAELRLYIQYGEDV